MDVGREEWNSWAEFVTVGAGQGELMEAVWLLSTHCNCATREDCRWTGDASSEAVSRSLSKVH